MSKPQSGIHPFTAVQAILAVAWVTGAIDAPWWVAFGPVLFLIAIMALALVLGAFIRPDKET